MWCHVCGKVPLISCKECNLAVYCSSECQECDQDNHYAFCQKTGVVNTCSGMLVQEKVEKGDLLWQERATCLQRGLEAFFERLKGVLPNALPSDLNPVNPVVVNSGLSFFLLASSCHTNTPNCVCSVEKVGLDYILSVYATQDIKPRSYVSLPWVELQDYRCIIAN